MSDGAAEQFGHDVLGPVLAEFCYRLWTIESQLEHPDQTALLFCARGGLRLHLAHQRFCDRAGLTSPTLSASLMVSRVAAFRSSLLRTVREGGTDLLPAAAATVGYEFRRSTLRGLAAALSGVEPSSPDPQWDAPASSRGLARLLQAPAGAAVAAAVVDQGELFSEHLRRGLGGRDRAVLVDTGFFGTTRELVAEGHPDLDVSSVLLARAYRPDLPRRGRTVGLLVEADAYRPWLRRTALLRYWHFVEWLFEPELPSVRRFDRVGDDLRSNLEVADWQQRVPPTAGSAFAGALRYLDDLPAGPAATIATDADRAWTRLHRAIVAPSAQQAATLAITQRSNDFGRDSTWVARPWRGPVAVLRGSTIWREGEIAASGTRWRVPLLLAIEAAYTGRVAYRVARSRWHR